MSLALRSVAAPPSVDTFAPGIQAALALLTEAHSCAQELHRDAWDFAVELHSLAEPPYDDSRDLGLALDWFAATQQPLPDGVRPVPPAVVVATPLPLYKT